MSNNEQMIHETDERSPIDVYFEDAGVSIIQSLALIALANQIEPRSPREIDALINTAQGDEPGYIFPTNKSSTTGEFFRNSLGPLGYAKPMASVLESKRQPVTKYRITDYGIAWGLPPAAATLNWQLRHQDIALQNLLGRKRTHRHRQGGESGATLRLGLYQDILDRPDGAAYDELTTETRSRAEVLRLTKELNNQGVLDITRQPVFRERVFTLTEPDDTRYLKINQDLKPGTKAVRLALQHLHNRGVTHFTGTDLLAAFHDIMPRSEIPDHAIIRSFTTGRKEMLPFVHTEDFVPNRRYSAKISVSPDYAPAISELIELHHSLKTDPDYRDEVRETAFTMLDNAADIAALVRIARESTAGIGRLAPRQWEERILKHIPLGGIAIDALYQLVSADMPRRVGRLSFRQRLSKLKPHVTITDGQPMKGGDPGSVRFAYEPSEHHSDWQNHAACKDMNPAIFTDAKTKSEVRVAKTVCRGCPVRSDCLGYAVERGVDFPGVWGNTSMHQRQKMPLAVRNKVKALIQEAEA